MLCCDTRRYGDGGRYPLGNLQVWGFRLVLIGTWEASADSPRRLESHHHHHHPRWRKQVKHPDLPKRAYRGYQKPPAPATTAVTNWRRPPWRWQTGRNTWGSLTRVSASEQGTSVGDANPFSGLTGVVITPSATSPAFSRVNLGIQRRGNGWVRWHRALGSFKKKKDPSQEDMGVGGGYRSPRRPPDAASAAAASSFTSCVCVRV